MPEKACTTCERTLPLEDFVRDARKPDGRGARCRDCHRAACRRYVERHPGRRLESSRRYYVGHREEHNARTVSWAKRNPERMRASGARSRQAHPETAREYRRRFGAEEQRRLRALYPLRYRARNKVNNAIARGLLPRAAVLACAYCGEPAREYHHHRGYDEAHWLDVVPVCKPCHRGAEVAA